MKKTRRNRLDLFPPPEPSADEAERTAGAPLEDSDLVEARECLKRGDMVRGYPALRRAIRNAGLPLDWFSPHRPADTSLH